MDNNVVVGPDRTGPRNQRRSPMVINNVFFPALMWNSRFNSVSGDPFDNSAGFQFPSPGANEDFGLEQVTGNPSDRYAFRTSPLRSLSLQSVPADITVTDEAAEVKSEFVINRKDFGIVYPGSANNLIRDEVVLKLSVRAPRDKN